MLKIEHVVVEELLKTLVGVVNAERFESVELENPETGNIENTDVKKRGKLVERARLTMATNQLKRRSNMALQKEPKA